MEIPVLIGIFFRNSVLMFNAINSNFDISA